jgi:hypothetical protein
VIVQYIFYGRDLRSPAVGPVALGSEGGSRPGVSVAGECHSLDRHSSGEAAQFNDERVYLGSRIWVVLGRLHSSPSLLRQLMG